MNTLSVKDFKKILFSEETTVNLENLILEENCDLVFTTINFSKSWKRRFVDNVHFKKGLKITCEDRCLDTLIFSNCTFEESLDTRKSLNIENILIDNHLEFRTCCFNGKIDIINTKEGKLFFKDSLCEGIVTVSNIKNCDLQFSASTDSFTSYSNLSIMDMKEGKLSIDRINIKELNLSGVSPEYIFIGFAEYETISFFFCQPKSLRISSYLDEEPIKINHLILSNFINIGKAFIKNTDIEYFELNNLTNEGSVSLQSTKVNEWFSCQNSTLNNTLFLNINFENCIVDLSSSFFEDCKFSRVKWQKNLLLESFHKKDCLETHQTQREVYRQLKQVYQKQGNNIEARVFYSHEMDAFQQELKYSNVLSFEDRIIVNTNAVFNNFGRSWVRPILWMFLFHSLFWALIGFDHYTIVSLENHNWNSLLEGISKYFELLIPTHPFNLFTKPAHKLVDILMRISSAYFIYMMLNSARKFRL